MEGVEQHLLASGDFIEGDCPSRPVHKHCYSVRKRGREGKFCFCLIVPDPVRVFTVVKTPGLSIQAKPAVISFSSFHCFISHCKEHLSCPLNLPVTTISQRLFAQNLTVLECLWSELIFRLIVYCSRLLVVVRQCDVSVSCVFVQSEFTTIWWRECRKQV